MSRGCTARPSSSRSVIYPVRKVIQRPATAHYRPMGDGMAGDLILIASAIITMDPSAPRAEALAVDTAAGTIAAVGTLMHCRAAAPGATERDLGDTVLLPGFIEAHSHP